MLSVFRSNFFIVCYYCYTAVSLLVTFFARTVVKPWWNPVLPTTTFSLDRYNDLEPIKALEVPETYRNVLNFTVMDMNDRVKSLLGVFQAKNYIQALEEAVFLASVPPQNTVFIPYVCMVGNSDVIDPVLQSEYIFGYPFNLSSVGVTANQIDYPPKNRDFIWWYRLFLYQLQYEVLNATGDARKYINISAANPHHTPVCYNPVTKLYHLDELRTRNIDIDLSVSRVVHVANLVGQNVHLDFYNKRTIEAVMKNIDLHLPMLRADVRFDNPN